MTRSFVRHDSFICATWLTHMCGLTSMHRAGASRPTNTSACIYVWHTCMRCMCNKTHLYARLDSFICTTWPIYKCNMWCILRMRDMTHTHSKMCDMTHTHSQMCDMTHTHSQHGEDLCVCMHMCGLTQTHCTRASTPRTASACMCVTHVRSTHARHDSCIRATWLIHMCENFHSNVGQGRGNGGGVEGNTTEDFGVRLTGHLEIQVPEMIHVCDMIYRWFMCVIWYTDDSCVWYDIQMIHVCDMIHRWFMCVIWYTDDSCVWYDIQMIHVCDMIYRWFMCVIWYTDDSCVWYDIQMLICWYVDIFNKTHPAKTTRRQLYVYGVRLTHEYAMNHAYVRHDPFYLARLTFVDDTPVVERISLYLIIAAVDATTAVSILKSQFSSHVM